MSGRSDCRKFAPNIFNKSKCTNCFRQKEEHSAEALESNRVSFVLTYSIEICLARSKTLLRDTRESVYNVQVCMCASPIQSSGVDLTGNGRHVKKAITCRFIEIVIIRVQHWQCIGCTFLFQIKQFLVYKRCTPTLKLKKVHIILNQLGVYKITFKKDLSQSDKNDANEVKSFLIIISLSKQERKSSHANFIIKRIKTENNTTQASSIMHNICYIRCKFTSKSRPIHGYVLALSRTFGCVHFKTRQLTK